MAEPVVRAVKVKSVITKTNIPVGDYAVNPYIGCTHACKYCYACFMKRFTGHAEPWGAFLDVKFWPEIKRPEKYAGKELFFWLGDGSLSSTGRGIPPHASAARAIARQRRPAEHPDKIRPCFA